MEVFGCGGKSRGENSRFLQQSERIGAHRCIIEISESGTSSFYPLQAKLIGSGTVSAQ